MKIIEVPILNDDGSVKTVVSLPPEEVQVLLQFALNFLTGTGLSIQVLAGKKKQEAEQADLSQLELKFND